MNNLEQVLKTYYGYDGFRPLQKEIILHTIGGGDSWKEHEAGDDGAEKQGTFAQKSNTTKLNDQMKIRQMTK